MSSEAIKDAGKYNAIMIYLHDIGYDNFKGELEAIKTIRENNIDISEFSLPYNSRNLDEWEQQTISAKENIKRIRENYQKLLKEGKIITLRREVL